MQTRIIPSTGEDLPVIGLGTWQTFDVEPAQYESLRDVVTTMQKAGGRLIDSSPMYGRSEQVIGQLIETLSYKNDFFYATKVWIQGADAGRRQIDASFRLMKRDVLDLLQIHNMVDWQTHLPYLRQLKGEGRLRYIGITHYQDSSHQALANIIAREPVDFVQFNYSILSRYAENFLLPFCADKGIATIINRPFGEGALFRKVVGKPLPPWAIEHGINNWSAYFLQYILAHPAVTCVIPATGKAVHATQNFEAGREILVDRSVLQKMIIYLENV